MATTADDVWRLLGELATAQQETERRFQETERRFQETERRFQETDHQFQEMRRFLRDQSQEAERRFQETERLMREQSQETDRKIQETVAENRRINRQLNQQIGDLGGKWGLFVENLVAPACETIFLEWGIPVHRVSQRVRQRQNGDSMEIDVLVLNQDHVLAVEVKSTLSVDDVKDFSEKLSCFREFFPEYEQRQLYGAVAGIGIDAGADRYAYRQGLFVLAQSGETMAILNDRQFQPRNW
jgi:hypothetical protein